MSYRSPRPALLRITGLLLLLVFTGLFQPQSVEAAPPDPLSGSDGVTINPNGGGTDPAKGLRIDVYNTQYQVFRNGMYQVYEESVDSYTDWLLWMLPPDSTSYGGYVIEMLAENNLDVPDFTTPDGAPDTYDYCYWSDEGASCFADNTAPEHLLETPATLGANKWRATVIMTGNDLYKLTLVYNYTSPNNYFDLSATLERKSGNTYIPEQMHLYFVADLTLNEADDGPTTIGSLFGQPAYGQYSPADENNAFSGMSELPGSKPTSIHLGYYECAGNGEEYTYPADGLDTAGCSGTGPGNEDNPKYGEPFSITLEDYQTDYLDADIDLDAGMGMHWQLTPTASSWTKEVRLVYSDYDWFAANVSTERQESEVCDKAPTMRLVPNPLKIAQGTSETLWVEVVNSCTDRPLDSADLLISYDFGLSAVGEGWLNLGQRIALQGLTLKPGELRAWPLTFTAAGDAVAPLNLVGEVYFAGSRASRTDHTVEMPAPVAAAPIAEPVPVPAPVVVAEPAALPVTLPNTSGGLGLVGLLLSAVGAASLVVAGRRMKR